ncbi:hypothetical protein [Rhodococcoides yunnanense]|uniref:hypothetical protein n=1 Tax=Rhodococcoides yunnanense TaxID=278209 RepID=UPI001114CB7B|nr:hypothetical protein [Rhodococcus yunnanensis]
MWKRTRLVRQHQFVVPGSKSSPLLAEPVGPQGHNCRMARSGHYVTIGLAIVAADAAVWGVIVRRDDVPLWSTSTYVAIAVAIVALALTVWGVAKSKPESNEHFSQRQELSGKARGYQAGRDLTIEREDRQES